MPGGLGSGFPPYRNEVNEATVMLSFASSPDRAAVLRNLPTLLLLTVFAVWASGRPVARGARPHRKRSPLRTGEIKRMGATVSHSPPPRTSRELSFASGQEASRQAWITAQWMVTIGIAGGLGATRVGVLMKNFVHLVRGSTLP